MSDGHHLGPLVINSATWGEFIAFAKACGAKVDEVEVDAGDGTTSLATCLIRVVGDETLICPLPKHFDPASRMGPSTCANRCRLLMLKSAAIF